MPNKRKPGAGAPQNNRNGAKAKTLSSHLHVRVSPSNKAEWVRAAGGEKLAPWVTRMLNNAALNKGN